MPCEQQDSAIRFQFHPFLSVLIQAAVYVLLSHPSITAVVLQPALLPSRRASPPFGWYSFYLPTEGRRLGRAGWLVTYRNKVPPSGVDRTRSPIPVLTVLSVG